MCYHFLELPDGNLIVECHSTPVPINVLQEIYSWIVNGLTMDDIVQWLRVRTVPNDHRGIARIF